MMTTVQPRYTVKTVPEADGKRLVLTNHGPAANFEITSRDGDDWEQQFQMTVHIPEGGSYEVPGYTGLVMSGEVIRVCIVERTHHSYCQADNDCNLEPRNHRWHDEKAEEYLFTPVIDDDDLHVIHRGLETATFLIETRLKDGSPGLREKRTSLDPEEHENSEWGVSVGDRVRICRIDRDGNEEVRFYEAVEDTLNTSDIIFERRTQAWYEREEE